MSRSDSVHQVAGLRFCVQLPGDDVLFPMMPMMLFLHGAGERGNDISKLHKHGPWRGPGAEHFLCVAPQCPAGCHWPAFATEIGELVRFVLDHWAVDRARVYATGLSMGGFGVWAAASANPGLFAALVPICGGFTPPVKTSLTALLMSAKHPVKANEIEPFKDMPIWLFHGSEDTTVDVNGSKAVYKALRRARQDVGDRLKKTIYKGVGHSCWKSAYSTPELYTWLLQHKLAMDRRDEFTLSSSMVVTRVALVGDFNAGGCRRTASCSNAVRRLLKTSDDVQVQLFGQAGLVFLPNLPFLAQKAKLSKSLKNFAPHISVCMVGLTDASSAMKKLNGCVEYLRDSYRRLIEDDCLQGSGFCTIIVGPPCRCTERSRLDTVCRELALELGCRYVDTHNIFPPTTHQAHYLDASHFNSAGAKKLAEVIAAKIQGCAADLERLRTEHSALASKRKRSLAAGSETKLQKLVEQLRTAKQSQERKHKTAIQSRERKHKLAIRKSRERFEQQRSKHKMQLARIHGAHSVSLEKLRRQVKLLKKRKQQ